MLRPWLFSSDGLSPISSTTACHCVTSPSSANTSARDSTPTTAPLVYRRSWRLRPRPRREDAASAAQQAASLLKVCTCDGLVSPCDAAPVRSHLQPTRSALSSAISRRLAPTPSKLHAGRLSHQPPSLPDTTLRSAAVRDSLTLQTLCPTRGIRTYLITDRKKIYLSDFQ